MPAQQGNGEKGSLRRKTDVEWQATQKGPMVEHAEMVRHENVAPFRIELIRPLGDDLHPGNPEHKSSNLHSHFWTFLISQFYFFHSENS